MTTTKPKMFLGPNMIAALGLEAAVERGDVAVVNPIPPFVAIFGAPQPLTDAEIDSVIDAPALTKADILAAGRWPNDDDG